MKRKLALLLAGVMALTMMPMNLFASSNNRITHTATVVPVGSLFYEEGLIPASQAGGYKLSNSGDVKEVVNGGDLRIEMKENLRTGDTVNITLSNANWFFRSNLQNFTSASALATYNTLGPNAQGLIDAGYKVNDLRDTNDGAVFNQSQLSGEVATFQTSTAGITGTSLLDYGFYARNNLGEGVYIRYGADPTGVSSHPVELYRLTMSAYDKKLATFEALTDIPSGQAFEIPIISITTEDEADVRIKVEAGSSSAISPSDMIFAVSSGGGTVTSVDSVETARKNISLGRIVVKETRISSMGEGGNFTVSAPSGYSFVLASDMNASGSNHIGFQNFGNTPTVAEFGYLPTNSGSNLHPVQAGAGHDYDEDTLLVHVEGLKRSDKVPGAIYLTGVSLKADSGYEATGNIEFKIRNVPYTMAGTGKQDLKITSQTFLAAEFVDWTIRFEAMDKTIPQLVSGRFVTRNNATYDEFHQASRVQFEENALSAWWSRRETKFALPTGVKFRQVEFTDHDHIQAPDATGKLVDFDTDGTWTVNQYDDQLNRTTDVKDTLASNKDADQYITVDEDSIDIYDLSIEDGEKAFLEFDSWLSVAADFAGDVTLTATGSAIPQDLPGVVIAKAIAPITLKSKVTDIKIGYQYQPVADIEITENVAGALSKDKEVRLSVTDMISTEMQFSPDTKIAVSAGDLKLGDRTTGFFNSNYQGYSSNTNGLGNGAGALSFLIDKPSTKASTIKLTSVGVKVDRTVPETNDRPYSVFAWGSAIAQNYQVNSTTGKIVRTCFDKPGIAAPYLKVVSAANDKTNVLTQEVRVTDGQPSYTVNGATTDMSAAAYVSTESNSMMVPLRFVANAFGIKDDQIIWSDIDKTVTLVHPTRTIQFKVGSDKMKMNGTEVAMVSPDGKAVMPENTDSRVYVPFRQIGIAFGIEVGWDDATRTAIYNPGTAITNNATTQTATPVDPAATAPATK